MDPRLTPANARVADLSLVGKVRTGTFVEGTANRIAVAVADLRDGPEGARVSQLVLGAPVRCYEVVADWAFVQSVDDDYVGYVEATCLGPDTAPTHRVTARATHAYAAPDFKSPDRASLPFGARLAGIGEAAGFLETAIGYVPRTHLVPADQPVADWVSAAERFLGTPYLWGGTTTFGIDCSGLVQMALGSAGIPCPRDSDQQEAALGQPLGEGEPSRRGDLVFWDGHVGIMTDDTMLLHANAHHMMVATEPLEEAKARIEAAEFGPVRRRARL